MRVYGHAQIWISTNIRIPDDKIRDEDYIIEELYKQFKEDGIDISEIEYLDYEFE